MYYVYANYGCSHQENLSNLYVAAANKATFSAYKSFTSPGSIINAIAQCIIKITNSGKN